MKKNLRRVFLLEKLRKLNHYFFLIGLVCIASSIVFFPGYGIANPKTLFNSEFWKLASTGILTDFGLAVLIIGGVFWALAIIIKIFLIRARGKTGK